MISAIASHILTLPGWLALLVVFALPALESSAFVGFIFPGEVALILGGVIASQGRVSLAAVLAAAIAGAIVGDTVGYAGGRRYGRGILDSTLGRFVKASHLDRAEAYLAERGGKAVFFGRFTAALRVLIPGLAGMSGCATAPSSPTTRQAQSAGEPSRCCSATSAAATGATSSRSRPAPGWAPCAGHRCHRGHHPAAPQAQPRGDTVGPATPSARQQVAAPHERGPSFLASLRSIVVIPTYNEAGNIALAIDRVHAASPGVDVLVVDDNSPDGTGGIVTGHATFAGRRSDSCAPGDHSGAGRVFLLSRTAKGGLGAAYRAGFAWALWPRGTTRSSRWMPICPTRQSGSRRCCRPSSPPMWPFGSRYVSGGGGEQLVVVAAGCSPGAGNVYVRLVLGLPVRDTTAGFKAFRRRALEDIDAVHSSSSGYCFQIENTWRAVRVGLRVTEVPITFTDRSVGTSKMSGSIAAEALTRVLVWRWRELRHGAVAPTKRVLEEPSHPRSRDVLPELARRFLTRRSSPSWPLAAPATSSTSPLQPAAQPDAVQHPRPDGGPHPGRRGGHVRDVRRQPDPDLARPVARDRRREVGLFVCSTSSASGSPWSPWPSPTTCWA